MTITSSVRKAGPYVGNGVATSFVFSFKVFNASEVVATKTAVASGAETVLALTTDYTVALNADQNANPGGTVTYNPSGVPMSSAYNLTITSNVLQTQGTDIPNAGGFYPEVVEDALDKNTILAQQLKEVQDRTLQFPVADSTPPQIPAWQMRALGYLMFDASGNPTISVGTASQAVSAAMAPVVTAATLAAARNTLMAAADVVAHATTSNIWGAREVTLTGAAVTFTDIADAPVAGAVAWVKQNAAHVWTNGATFAVQGGANYTAAAGDWIRVYATTVSTFEVTIFKASGIAAAQLAGSEDFAGVLELATVAEVLAGTAPGRACSPLNLASNKVFAANGYYKFPGAFIVQWGTFNIAGGSGGSTLTFPTAFPTACASVVATLQNALDTIRVDSIGVSTCIIYSGSGTPNCTWVAVGY